MSPMARNGTKTPPHPPAATAAVVMSARRPQTANNGIGTGLALPAHGIAPPPGPTAAEGVARRARTNTAATVAAPPIARRTAGTACHFLARSTAIPASEQIAPERPPISTAATTAIVKVVGGSLGT